MIDIVLGDDRGFGGLRARRHHQLFRRNRRQRCGFRARSKRACACDKSKGEFQKVAAFHNFSSFAVGEWQESFAAPR
jgi:hypothetical protein